MEDASHNDLSAEEAELYRIRHSLAHVLAQAVLELRPGTTLGFGPPIADGFYYDFVLSEPLTEAELPELEKKMKHIIKRGQKFEREDLPAQEAFRLIGEDMQEPYKLEYARELVEKNGLETLSFYKNGPFLDMCEGPHVDSTRQLPAGAFKLRSIAGAYWRGNSDNVQMTRIYAWAYKTPEELQARIKEHKLALANDHKKLGRDLDIFHIDDEIGKGLPLWLPNGTVIRDELEKLARELEFKDGYERVVTPQLAKVGLYYRTGHLPYYANGMFPFLELKERHEVEGGEVEEVVEQYALKPMNCPHHHKIFAARPRSYRDLPLRLAEYGNCYRYEESGALSGLLRVRGMCMNDAHIYCTEEQIGDEFKKVMDLHRRVYEILGLQDNYWMRLSTWDPDDPKGKDKYVDMPEAWEASTRHIRAAMDEIGMPYREVKGEGAFYGPKIDVQFRTVTGREETASTNQLDFCVPARLGLVYTNANDEEVHPWVLHRAPLGTHERFVAFLIEHYGGAFPTWLAPEQVRVMPVAAPFAGYAQKLVDELRSDFVRARPDLSADTLNKRIRTAQTSKIPNTLVVGEREEQDGSVTLRRYGSREQESMPFEEFRARLRKAIATRAMVLD
ncbi:Threonyl-tRNA synthetase [Enhygromyxa salina]|uniref:Threonine--tRNA ligase n=1 Tax=Enhygromyxa salina TaxID=215803 RepID=A0A0C1ZBZ8_9BACT|nr:threonine--tRNA ligase [Enhygromyxa salina]KIG15219.1 Threonyl-tRNA synthetase [Enhygromyxa salina]